MMSVPVSTLRIAIAVSLLDLCLSAGPYANAANPVAKAATVAEAAKVLDLVQFPRLPSAEPVQNAHLASLSYLASEQVIPAFKFQKDNLVKQGWKEAAGSSVTDQYASGTFTKAGYQVSVAVMPNGKQVNVAINQHGNLDLGKIPLPPGTKSLYAGPISQIWTSDETPEATTAAIAKLLEANHWLPYGEAGPIRFYRQNAVRLTVMVSEAPAQGGKTSIHISSELLSAELSAPPKATGLQYADATTTIVFSTTGSIEEVADYYRKTLSETGWEVTTERPFKIDIYDTLIFRNKAKDLAQLSMLKTEDGTKVQLAHQTAAVAAKEEEAFQLAMANKKAEMAKPKPTVSVTLPEDASDIDANPTRIEFQLATGQGKAATTSLLAQFTKAGWKKESSVVEGPVGTVTLTNGKLSLTIDFVDPGFIPAEVTIRLSGGELEVATAKKPAKSASE